MNYRVRAVKCHPGPLRSTTDRFLDAARARPRWAVYMASRPPTAALVVVRVAKVSREGAGQGPEL